MSGQRSRKDLACTADATAQLWDPSDWESVGQTLGDHTGGASAMAFSPDNRLLAICGYQTSLWALK